MPTVVGAMVRSLSSLIGCAWPGLGLQQPEPLIDHRRLDGRGHEYGRLDGRGHAIELGLDGKHDEQRVEQQLGRAVQPEQLHPNRQQPAHACGLLRLRRPAPSPRIRSTSIRPTPPSCSSSTCPAPIRTCSRTTRTRRRRVAGAASSTCSTPGSSVTNLVVRPVLRRPLASIEPDNLLKSCRFQAY
jgi:hypothetical protein